MLRGLLPSVGTGKSGQPSSSRLPSPPRGQGASRGSEEYLGALPPGLRGWDLQAD